MKKTYEAPDLEIELYELEGAIAANCAPDRIVTFGPDYDEHTPCEEFDGSGVWMLSQEISFYEKGTVCTCYYTAGGEGYFTS